MKLLVIIINWLFHIPTIMTSNCISFQNWFDSKGNGCDWYNINGCINANNNARNGISATNTCCICGGGKVQGNCVSLIGWSDSKGDTCSWYEDNGCSNVANFAKNGMDAASACCPCGSGIIQDMSCDRSHDCNLNAFCWEKYCYDTNDEQACKRFYNIPTDDGWLWERESLFYFKTFRCPKTLSTNGWYDGGADQSCSEGCSSYGLLCSEKYLNVHNVDVDNSAKLLALIKYVGGTTNATKCIKKFSTGANVPLWSPTKCFYSENQRAIKTFNCMSKPTQDGQDRHRLCYCHAETSHIYSLSYNINPLIIHHHPVNGWYDSGMGKSCSEGCSLNGLICSEKQLLAHNADVDTSTKVLQLIMHVGGTTNAVLCKKGLSSNINKPLWGPSKCVYSETKRTIKAFNCMSKTKRSNEGRHRLCYCHIPETYSNTNT